MTDSPFDGGRFAREPWRFPKKATPDDYRPRGVTGLSRCSSTRPRSVA